MKNRKKLYILTGIVQSKIGRQNITNPLTKKQVMIAKKNIQRDVKIAIPKYKWVTNLKIKKLK